MARAEVVWCQGYSEPDAGSDLANVACRARRAGDEWVVSGQKIWTTFAQHADWMFAIVRTEPGSERHAGLSYMLIPLDQPGVQVTPIRTMLGDSGFNSVFFDDARTSADNVLGAPGAGWAAAMTTLGHERATSVLNYQFSFVREMRELRALAMDRGAADDVVLRDRLIDAYVGLEIMGYNNMRSLTRALADGEFGPEASIGKYYWSRWHQTFTELAMDVLGPDSLLGTSWDTGPDRASTGIRRAFVRARAETIYAGTSEIQKNIISERVLGMPREPKRAGPMSGPLDGVRVLDLSRILAAPFATQLLGDLGADIIKVERPGSGDDARQYGPPFLDNPSGDESGGSESGFYLSANRNKRSITIDRFLTRPGRDLSANWLRSPTYWWKTTGAESWTSTASATRR